MASCRHFRTRPNEELGWEDRRGPPLAQKTQSVDTVQEFNKIISQPDSVS